MDFENDKICHQTICQGKRLHQNYQKRSIRDQKGPRRIPERYSRLGYTHLKILNKNIEILAACYIQDHDRSCYSKNSKFASIIKI
jgi:hypothetical protein